jgi:ankyrin repeat protein
MKSVSHLNALHVACILGEEDLSLDILDFFKKTTDELEAKKLLLEFLGRQWGNGNTILHLASFNGMCELVRKLIECGANPNKKNERSYTPVDCADDPETRNVFSVVESSKLARSLMV